MMGSSQSSSQTRLCSVQFLLSPTVDLLLLLLLLRRSPHLVRVLQLLLSQEYDDDWVENPVVCRSWALSWDFKEAFDEAFEVSWLLGGGGEKGGGGGGVGRGVVTGKEGGQRE